MPRFTRGAKAFSEAQRRKRAAAEARKAGGRDADRSASPPTDCAHCGQGGPDASGIQCDAEACRKWICIRCLDHWLPTSCPEELYLALDVIGEFPFQCHLCLPDRNLPQQLLDAGIRPTDTGDFPDSRLWLEYCGVEPEVLDCQPGQVPATRRLLLQRRQDRARRSPPPLSAAAAPPKEPKEPKEHQRQKTPPGDARRSSLAHSFASRPQSQMSNVSNFPEFHTPEPQGDEPLWDGSHQFVPGGPRLPLGGPAQHIAHPVPSFPSAFQPFARQLTQPWQGLTPGYGQTGHAAGTPGPDRGQLPQTAPGSFGAARTSLHPPLAHAPDGLNWEGGPHALAAPPPAALGHGAPAAQQLLPPQGLGGGATPQLSTAPPSGLQTPIQPLPIHGQGPAAQAPPAPGPPRPGLPQPQPSAQRAAPELQGGPLGPGGAGLPPAGQTPEALLQQMHFQNQAIWSLLTQQGQGQRGSQGSSRSGLQLPKAKIPTFTGKQTDFPLWWNQFRSRCHENPSVEPQHKMDCLVTALEGGTAADMITGFMGLACHYETAIQTLLRRFNNPFLLQEKLWQELDSVPNVRSDLSNAQSVFDTLNGKVQMLRACMAAENQLDDFATRYARRQTNSFLLSLFYAERIQSPGQAMLERWRVDELLRVLERLLGFVLARGGGGKVQGGQGGPQRGQGGQNSSPEQPSEGRKARGGRNRGKASGGPRADAQGPAADQPFSMAMASPAPARQDRQKGRPRSAERPRCAFCQSGTTGHISNDCPIFTTPQQRRDKAMELRLCLNCLDGAPKEGATERASRGHWARRCPSKVTCSLCQRRHHSALHDPDWVPPSRSSGAPGMAHFPLEDADDSLSDVAPFFEDQLIQHPLQQQEDETAMLRQPCEPKPASPAHDSTKMLTMVAEMVHPQTGEAVEVNVFLDGGAKSHSVLDHFITGPPFLPALTQPKERRIGRYGTGEVFTQRAQLTEFILRAKTGAQLLLCAFTAPAICPDLTLRPQDMSAKDRRTVLAHRCVNQPPEQPQRFPVHVCLGQEDLNTLLNHKGSHKVHLEGSLTIHVTAFGAFLDGSRQGSKVHKARLTEGPAATSLLSHMPSEETLWERERNKQGFALYQAPLSHQLLADDPLPGLESVHQPSLEGVDKLFRSYLVGVEDEAAREKELDYERDIVRRFAKTHIRLVDLPNGKQRYEVKLLWKPNLPKVFPNSFPAAYKCAERVLHKLCPDNELTDKFYQYHKTFRTYSERDMIAEVPEEDIGWLGHGYTHLSPMKQPPNQAPSQPTFWLQHFPRYKESSSFTAVRPVFNASHPSGEQKISLNSCLEPGPDIMGKLTRMLLASRVPPVLMTYDCEKAYLSLSLAKEDQAATRFVWLKEEAARLEGNVALMHFAVLPFGLAPAAFLLHLAVGYHLDQHPGPLADRIRNSYYQDNFLVGCLADPEDPADPAQGGEGKNRPSDALKLYKGVKKLFGAVSMNMREFASNSAEFNAALPSEDRHPQLAKAEPKVGLLGLVWRTQKDSLAFPQASEAVRTRFQQIADGSLWTKRLVCVFAAKLSWDPLGLLAPCTTNSRLLIQTTWVEGLGWDEILPASLQAEATDTLGQLFNFHELTLPRRVLLEHNAPYRLIVVADASEKALCAAVYCWQSHGPGPARIVSRLTIAKTKNALKAREVRKPRRTIPELELNSYVLGIRLAKYTREAIGGTMEGLHLMGDSQLVLYQLKNQRRLKPYVQRRVTEVMEAEPSLHFLPSAENCADLGTRGCALGDLPEEWWLGPALLRSAHAKDWPRFDPTVNVAHKLEEQLQLLNVFDDEEAQVEPGPFGLDPANFSTISRLLAVTAWAQRAIQRFKGQMGQPKFLTPQERLDSLRQWHLYEQHIHFPDTQKKLLNGQADRLTKELDLYLDEYQVIRLGGRLDMSPLSWSAKHPALLGRKSEFTKLAIQDAHVRVNHGGARETLNALRHDWWPPRATVEVKKALARCSRCRLIRGGPLRPPKMGPLPAARLNPSPVWSHVGADCAGPFLVRIRLPTGDVLSQIHILVLTDLFSRCVALEPIWDQSSEELLLAFQRHFSRHGRASAVWSDNAAALLKTEKVMANEKSLEEDLGTRLGGQQIVWHHSQPVAPWAAGVWEVMVKLAKKVLKASLWRRTVTFSTFTALLAAAEATMNTRPLCPAHGDQIGPGDKVLTPAHLAMGSDRLLAPFFPENDANDPDWVPASTPQLLSKAFARGQTLIAEARAMFIAQYIVELRSLHRTHFKRKRGQVPWLPQPHHVYLVEEKGLDRQRWRRCKVVELLAGRDGEYRFAKVLLASQTGGPGTLTVRAVQLLVPLEAQIEEEEKPEAAAPASAPAHARPEKADEQREGGPDTTHPAAHPMTTRSRSKGKKVSFGTVTMVGLVLSLLVGLASAAPAAASPTAKTTARTPPPQSHVPQLPEWLPSPAFVCPAYGGHRIQTPDLTAEAEDCHSYTDTKPVPLTVDVYRPSNAAASTHAVFCALERVSGCTSTTILQTKSLASIPQTSREPISQTECQLVNETRRWKGHNLVRNNVAQNLWSTQLPLQLNYASWGKKCTAIENLVLETTQVWSGDGRTLAATSADVSHCAPAKGSCLLPNAVLVWDGMFWEQTCPWHLIGTYKASYAQPKLLVPALQIATKTTKAATDLHDCLPKGALQTTQHFVVLLTPPKPKREAPQAEKKEQAAHTNEVPGHKVPASALDTPPYPPDADVQGARINFALDHAYHLFNEEHQNTCLMNVKLGQLSLAGLWSHPTEVVRAWLGEKALKASWHGPHLIVRACHPVQITQIYEEFNVDGKCFDLLPVRIQDSHELYFIGDASGELTKEAPRVRCMDKPSLPSVNGALAWPPLGLPHHGMRAHEAELKERLLKDPPALHSRPDVPRDALRAWVHSVPRLFTLQSAVINYTTMAHGGNEPLREALVGLGEAAVVMGNGSLTMVTHLGSEVTTGVGHLTTGLLTNVEKTVSNLFGGISDILALVAVAGGLVLAWYTGLLEWVKRKLTRQPEEGNEGEQGSEPQRRIRTQELAQLRRQLLPADEPLPTA